MPADTTMGHHAGVVTMRTDHLQLRPWREQDAEPFAALNADAETMRFLPGVLDRAGSDEMIDRIRAHLDEHGYGLWAVEVPGSAPFIGYVGLVRQTFPAHFTPAVEVGWRLAREHWNQGYATEAATAALRFGFTESRLEEIVSLTVPDNLPSRRVMEKLGLHRDPADDFDHPRAPERLRRHVLYRVSRTEWEGAESAAGGRDDRRGAGDRGGSVGAVEPREPEGVPCPSAGSST
jgi:RimJ/RimL family protein N-acetyltransferase